MPNNDERILKLEAQLALKKQQEISEVVNGLVGEMRLSATEAPRAVARAMADPTYLEELRLRPQMLPGAAPLNSGVMIVGEDAQNVLKGIERHIVSGPQAMATAVHRSREIGAIWQKERERVLPVLNAAGTNTIDASLKRVLIMQETVRAFATRVAPLRAFATRFENVPLQGTDSIAVPYYPLQAAASKDFTDGDGTGGTGYTFGGATNTQSRQITLNKRKYQPMDYSSAEFRRQPWFDTLTLGRINAEKLGVDVVTDIMSIITAANFGAPVKELVLAAASSDDVTDIQTACTDAMWPDLGRSLIVNTALDNALKKDPSYKLALNIGGTETIRDGKLPRISGFDYFCVPTLPDNGENLAGMAVFKSAIGAAFAPVDPAPGVRAQLVAYEIATDAATGISMNYRHWGLAQADRDFEIIECAYGYDKLVEAALKRIVHP